jgi:hypothetical protein
MPPPLNFLFLGKRLPLVRRVEVRCSRKWEKVMDPITLSGVFAVFAVAFAVGYDLRERKRMRRRSYYHAD